MDTTNQLIARAESGFETSIPYRPSVCGGRGDGTYDALETAQMDGNGECPVVVWARGWKPGDTQEVIAPDFGAYLLMTIKQGVASLDEEE
jgi:hypothetical protein